MYRLFLLVLLLSACTPKKPNVVGHWYAEIPTSIGILPFEIEIDSAMNAFAINGEERLRLDTMFVENDSVFIDMEVFEAQS